jgi:hypothetical protein
MSGVSSASICAMARSSSANAEVKSCSEMRIVSNPVLCGSCGGELPVVCFFADNSVLDHKDHRQ